MTHTRVSAPPAHLGAVLFLAILAVGGSLLGTAILFSTFSSDMSLKTAVILVPLFIVAVGLAPLLAWVPVKWRLRHNPRQLTRLLVCSGLAFAAGIAIMVVIQAT